MLLRTLKDRYLVNHDMIFDYYPKDGKEIYIEPNNGCWQLNMIRSYPLDNYVELYSNNILMDSYTWDDNLDIKVINTVDYKPLPMQGLSPQEMFEENKHLMDHCDRMDIFYIPKTRNTPPRFKN